MSSSIRNIGIFVTGLAVLSTTAYFIKKNFFSTQSPSPASSNISSVAISSCASSKKIHDLIQNVETSTKLDSPYSITLPLLGAAYSHNRISYETWKQRLLNAYSIDESQSSTVIAQKLETDGDQNAWILGRLLVASMLMNDDKTSHKIADVIQLLLKQSTSVNAFGAWAWGYLAIYYAQTQPAEFPAIKRQMLDYIQTLSQDPKEKGKDNVSWAIALALQSIDNKKEHDQLMSDLITFTDSSSVVEALQKIPPEDFRAWAVSLTLEAAKKLKDDQTLIDDLSQELPKSIEGSPSDADKMLGLLIPCHG
jgi:hypothetical protein